MEDICLYNMIKYLQNGTKLHIGVLFFGSYGNKMCELPDAHRIHTSTICEEIKTSSKVSYKRCVRCRNLALRKALRTKKTIWRNVHKRNLRIHPPGCNQR